MVIASWNLKEKKRISCGRSSAGKPSRRSSLSGSVSELLKLPSPFRIERLIQHGELLTSPIRIQSPGAADQQIEIGSQPTKDHRRDREHEDDAPEIPLYEVRVIPPVTDNRFLAGRTGGCLSSKNQAGNDRQGGDRERTPASLPGPACY